jgi:CHAT domain-containing protein/tetratricopeptide (TPR) repeat protein
MLMIRPRGRLVHCVVFLIGISCGFPGLFRSDPLSPNPISTPAPVAVPTVRILKDLKTRASQGIEPGVVHVYEFDLKPGEYVRFVVDQDGADVETAIFADGLFLFKVDSLTKAHGPEDVPLLASEATSFRIEISTLQQGQYRPRIAIRRPATEEDRAWFEGAKAYDSCRSLPAGETPDREIEACYLKAARFWEKAGYDLGRADALTKLGKLYKEEPGSHGRSIAYYREALALCQKAGSRVREVGILGSIGVGYLSSGESKLAEEFLQKALRAAREVGDWPEEATGLMNLCKLNSQASEFERAFADCGQALVLCEKQQDQEKIVEVLNLMGRLYVELEQFEKGFEYHRKALGLVQLDSQRAYTWTHLGDAYLLSGRPHLAVVYYKKALKIQRGLLRQAGEATSLNNLAVAYLNSSDLRAAKEALDQSVSLFERAGDRRNQISGIVNLGWVLRTWERPREAMEAFGRALKLARGAEYPNAEVSALLGIAVTERDRGNLRAAQARIEQAIAVVESQLGNISQRELRSAFFAGRQNLYEFLVEVLMERHRLQPGEGHDVSAFEASERAQVRSLRETLSGRLIPPHLGLREIQQRILDPETMLLEYVLGDPYSYLFAVTSTEFASFTLSSGEKLEGTSRDVYRLLRKSHKREYRLETIRKSSELSRLLLGQVAGRLDRKRLLVVAPPAVQYVSFAALPNPAAPSRSGEWPEMMIERYEIVSAPSASVIAPLRLRKREPEDAVDSVAVLADSVSHPKDERLAGVHPELSLSEPELDALQRLRYSDDEAKEIARWFPAESFLTSLGFDSTRDLVLSGKLNHFRILHLAAHGYLNREEAGLSGLVLSRYDRAGRRVDGLLRARDVEALDLSADLVVLSACGTALGKEIRGEGLVGLTQAFFSAGPPRVIVSLWDVDDQATSELMSNLYRHLQKDRMSPAAALREAQLAMMKTRGRSAPMFWGGFVLQGDWQTSF